MTGEEAIKVLERVEDYVGIHYINGVEDPYINPYLLKAIDFAVAALREQEGRMWIPVEEKLPEPESRCIILAERQGYKGGIYHDVMCGFYENGKILSDDSKVCWDCDMKRKELYIEEKDDFLVPEGWYEEMCNQIDDYNVVAIGDKVTHWIPLPEPPKEDAL